MFSEYQLQIIEKNEFSFDKNAKLIPNLGNKKNANSVTEMENFI